MLLPHAEKAPETENGIGDIAAQLVDHQALNSADLLAAGAANRRAFHTVAGDQAVGLMRGYFGLHVCLQSVIRRLPAPFRLAIEAPAMRARWK